MSVYTRASATANRLLAPSKFGATNPDGTSAVTLTRKTVTPAANSWEAHVVASTTETLLAQVFGVDKEFVGLPADEPNNGVVLQSDLSVICAMPAGGYAPGDLVSVNGRPVAVILTRRIPAAGTPVALRLVVRG